MAELKHGAHECVLTSPEIVADGICNICYKDEPVEFACDTCNFDLCRSCSKLPLEVSHDFHIEHPLKLCVGKKDGKTRYMLCSGCGSLFSDAFYYTCKECEIYMHLSCAVLKSIETSWDAEEKLHYSHAHLLRRCRPGQDARGACLVCELPLTPSAICYGCVQCYSFVHERCCLDFPREIHHPVHPAHPLIRLDFTHTCGAGKNCDACGLHIDGSPLGCSKCNFNLHLRCADSLLRSMWHGHHQHKMFYVAADARRNLGINHACRICKKNDNFLRDAYYHCMECGWNFHFNCCGIPKSVFRKSSHIHPLVCKVFLPKDGAFEYCDVCETMVHTGHHAYSCKDCDFLSHIECILRKEAPSPLYLKDLYSRCENATRPAHLEECETKLVVNDIWHNHVLKFGDFKEFLMDLISCGICREGIQGTLWKCETETCEFRAHDSCVKLRQQSRYRFHLNHPLTLLPSYPAGVIMNCDTCKEKICSFNLFCRICNFIICIRCMIKAKKFLGELHRGQKFIRYEEEYCLTRAHTLVHVMVSRSYPVACTICHDRLCGNVVSCMECEDIYHFRCVELAKLELIGHRIHPDHRLSMKMSIGSKCIACKLDITKYAFLCYFCSVSFHLKCIQAVGLSQKVKNHEHYLYNFWSDSTLLCTVCNKPCGPSFYGCIACDFSAHVECTGFPTYVKSKRHRHLVMGRKLTLLDDRNCSFCGLRIKYPDHLACYSCNHCEDVFHMKCIMSMDERKEVTEDEQIKEIYLMYIEQELFNLLKDKHKWEFRMATMKTGTLLS